MAEALRGEAYQEHEMPTFTWEALQRQLTGMAASEEQRSMVAPLVSGYRKMAAFYPPEMLLKEVLLLTWLLLDESWSDNPGVDSIQPT